MCGRLQVAVVGVCVGVCAPVCVIERSLVLMDVYVWVDG